MKMFPSFSNDSNTMKLEVIKGRIDDLPYKVSRRTVLNGNNSFFESLSQSLNRRKEGLSSFLSYLILRHYLSNQSNQNLWEIRQNDSRRN